MQPKKNPFRDPEKRAARLLKVLKERGTGPVAPPQPLPKEGGHLVQLAALDGVPVTLRFAQQPPAGSIPLPEVRRDWAGYLLFMAPDGEIWKVPNIWYNRTWAQRCEELRHELARVRERLAFNEEAMRRNPVNSREWRDASFLVPRDRELARKLEKRVEWLLKHADLEACPSTSPIDEVDDQDEISTK